MTRIPVHAPAYERNRRTRNAESRRKHSLRTWGAPDLFDLSKGEFGVDVRLPPDGRLSSLARPVGHVLVVGAKEQVVGVDAARHVALVADEHLGIEGASKNTPRKAVRPMVCASPPEDSVVEVVPADNGSGPQPAPTVRLWHGMMQQTLFERHVVSGVIGVNLPSSHCRAPIAMKVRGSGVGGTATDSRSDCSGDTL